MTSEGRSKLMTQQHTWRLLSEVLASIKYTRDEPPTSYKRFHLETPEENYAVLYIFTFNKNTYKPDQMRYTRHEFVVPVATYNRAAWVRWVFDRILSIETHETTECFQVDGVRIYAPHHGNGWDPYTIWYDGHPDEQAKAPGDD
jgi:hypothetical protein